MYYHNLNVNLHQVFNYSYSIFINIYDMHIIGTTSIFLCVSILIFTK